MSDEEDFFSLLEQDLLVSLQDAKSTQEEAFAEVIANRITYNQYFYILKW